MSSLNSPLIAFGIQNRKGLHHYQQEGCQVFAHEECHSGLISITLDSSVIIYLSQTKESLIRRISLDAGAITMFAKPRIHCTQKITFTHLSKAQTLTYEAEKIILVQCGIFKLFFITSDVLYHWRTPVLPVCLLLVRLFIFPHRSLFLALDCNYATM